MHDLMFANQSSLDNEGLAGLVEKVGLNVEKFKECMGSNKYAAYIDKDMVQGKEVGVKSTPTFFINGRMIHGAQSMNVFEEEIRKHL